MQSSIETFLASYNIYLKSWQDIAISDVFDIAIVTIFIYFFLKWAKNTRAWSLTKGIFILILLWVCFKLFKLDSVAWILGNVFKVGGWVAAIILFQPELRKALEELGKGNFMPKNRTPENTEINEELIKTVKILANDCIGALICIEQNIALGEYESTGTQIDGIITSQLLINIFTDKTPLHDGAVIIRKNRLAAAGCILPVTSIEIGKELGTRHRAAVGLSETSDAIILVVSEETGVVSIAQAGKLQKTLSYEEIFNMLQNTLKEQDNTKKTFFGRWK